jgi:DMATS type aromatic prenyltransferase
MMFDGDFGDFTQETFITNGSERLRVLCNAVGFDEQRTDDMLGLFSELLAPWGDRRIGTSMPWRSDIGEEGTPYEFSLALSDGVPEVRIMVEAQGEGGTLASNRDAARETVVRLANKFGLSLERFRAIEGLFLPEAPVGRYVLWHAAVVRPNKPFFMKVYLNPKVRGESQAPALIEEALKRLGFASAWPSVVAACKRGPLQDTLKYFSIDLTEKKPARVKIYVYHHDACAQNLEEVAALARTYTPGAVTAFCRAMTGSTGVFPGAPIATCLTFTENDKRPEISSTYVPFLGHVSSDLEASNSIRRFLEERGGDVTNFNRAIAAFPTRSLDRRAGMLSYASLRNGDGAPRVTVYLNPELYAASTRSSAMPSRPAPIHSEIQPLQRGAAGAEQPATFEQALSAISYHQVQIASHPFLAHLEQRGSFEEIRAIAPRVAFFVMCFQDVIRLMPLLTTDPALREFGGTHEREDKGHDRWFLHDLEQFGVSCDVETLFSDEQASIRDIVYEQIADMVRSTSDCARLGVVLSLEAAGAEFFDRIIDVLERAGRTEGLKYFARSHQRVEQSHEILQETREFELASLTVSPEALMEVLAIIEHTFATMTRLADDLLAHVQAVSSHVQAVSSVERRAEIGV